MNCKKNTFKKMLLICIFVELGESNAKIFDELNTHEKAFELGFNDRTEEQNQKFLRNWFKEHNLKMKDFDVLPLRQCLDYDKNGTPIIVRRVKHRG